LHFYSRLQWIEIKRITKKSTKTWPQTYTFKLTYESDSVNDNDDYSSYYNDSDVVSDKDNDESSDNDDYSIYDEDSDVDNNLTEENKNYIKETIEIIKNKIPVEIVEANVYDDQMTF